MGDRREALTCHRLELLCTGSSVRISVSITVLELNAPAALEAVEMRLANSSAATASLANVGGLNPTVEVIEEAPSVAPRLTVTTYSDTSCQTPAGWDSIVNTMAGLASPLVFASGGECVTFNGGHDAWFGACSATGSVTFNNFEGSSAPTCSGAPLNAANRMPTSFTDGQCWVVGSGSVRFACSSSSFTMAEGATGAQTTEGGSDGSLNLVVAGAGGGVAVVLVMLVIAYMIGRRRSKDKKTVVTAVPTGTQHISATSTSVEMGAPFGLMPLTVPLQDVTQKSITADKVEEEEEVKL